MNQYLQKERTNELIWFFSIQITNKGRQKQKISFWLVVVSYLQSCLDLSIMIRGAPNLADRLNDDKIFQSKWLSFIAKHVIFYYLLIKNIPTPLVLAQ